jgi:hypothetical protein
MGNIDATSLFAILFSQITESGALKNKPATLPVLDERTELAAPALLRGSCRHEMNLLSDVKNSSKTDFLTEFLSAPQMDRRRQI